MTNPELVEVNLKFFMTGPLKHKQEEDHFLLSSSPDVWIETCSLIGSPFLFGYVSDGPGHQLSEGEGVVVGQGGRAEDNASALWVFLQHFLSLHPSHAEETPAGTKEQHVVLPQRRSRAGRSPLT